MLIGVVGLVEFVGFQFTVVSSSGICELGFTVSLMFLCGVSSLSLSLFYIYIYICNTAIHACVHTHLCVGSRVCQFVLYKTYVLTDSPKKEGYSKDAYTRSSSSFAANPEP